MTRYAIQAENPSKHFWLNSERHTSLKEIVVRRGNRPKGREFWALQDATFDIERGSTFGLMGQNGSGKSTTLKVLAGYLPTDKRPGICGWASLSAAGTRGGVSCRSHRA